MDIRQLSSIILETITNLVAGSKLRFKVGNLHFLNILHSLFTYFVILGKNIGISQEGTLQFISLDFVEIISK